MQNIFDSHAHYDDERFDGDRDAVLGGLPGQGVRYVLNAACDLDSVRSSIALAEKFEFVYCSVGVHPHEAKGTGADLCAQLRVFAQHPKAVAIGEIGLDYHYDFSPREQQLAVFRAQLALAVERDMPVIVHDREAHEDTLRLLKEFRPKGIVHCYSGSVEMARELVALGMYIGFTGVVTFKNARRALEVADDIPIERMLIETDCPYMAPEPYRGKRCDSSMLVGVVETLAARKELQAQDLADITCANACRVYGISPSCSG